MKATFIRSCKACHICGSNFRYPKTGGCVGCSRAKANKKISESRDFQIPYRENFKIDKNKERRAMKGVRYDRT